ncbi:PREDICTED: uncharacterized protein LOC101296291 [Fragaria vesca subsp. vesca]|uniref:uncharacterized protein LOC101296291 n=1 Tax=Fragaria vesca subsp. vesca TaxID=101020 RepID=UPI0002C30090|nr:PREDICTED: uncharacterized protein LOC101296291 [Fragaria vesca subsp. vesca]
MKVFRFCFGNWFWYAGFRTSAAQILSPHITSRLFLREIQAALALGVFAAIKIAREETWEGFISEIRSSLRKFFFLRLLLSRLPLDSLVRSDICSGSGVSIDLMVILLDQTWSSSTS